MNAAHLHLLVNHLPLFASLFAAGVLAYALYRNLPALVNVGLVLALVAGVGAFAASQTGERAEGVVEELPGVTETAIEAHEGAAEAATWAAIVTGLLALGGLALPDRAQRTQRLVAMATLALTLLTFALVARAANLGGMIRHTEIGSATYTPNGYVSGTPGVTGAPFRGSTAFVSSNQM
ncbi:MAG: hypothetical protein OEO79_01010 [Gemmatimonadota bacterium]|nr:hypothetical protein [Gemmatimonadota bacterium]MDH3422827.1 hypothetical protein [Gemmatimonadota bacterium]